MDHGTDDTSNAVAKDDETAVVPDTAATEAADAGHTLAANIADGETQSIHAWSREHDDATELLGRRSWKLPIALAAITAAAAITAGVIQLWPHQTAPASQTPVAAAPTLSPDVQFINLLNQGLKNEPGFRGAHQADPDAIATGHLVCEKMSNLYPGYGPAARDQIIHWILTEGGAPTQHIAATVESAAEHAYCPQYQH